MAGQVFCTLETPRTVVANMRVLEHIAVGEAWRLVEQKIEVAVGSCIPRLFGRLQLCAKITVLLQQQGTFEVEITQPIQRHNRQVGAESSCNSITIRRKDL